MEHSNSKNNIASENKPHHSIEISADPFYSKENLQHIRDGIAALDAGLGVEHDIKEG
jgi:hypothetical protein